MAIKNHHLIMLPSLGKSYNSGLYLDDKGKLHSHNVTNGGKQQNLYVLSNEALKDGDYFVWYSQKREEYEIHKYHSDAGYGIKTYTDYDIKTGSSSLVNHSGNCGKIVATTDNSLKINICDTSYVENKNLVKDFNKPLPKISIKIIEYYIEQYNKGNIITDIEVEYNCQTLGLYSSEYGFPSKEIEVIKVDEDNCISIVKEEKIYTKSELLQFIELFHDHSYGGIDNETKNKWIKENIK